MTDRRYIEAWAPGSGSSGSGVCGSLPEDLQRDQSLRIQAIYCVGVVMWAITLAMDVVLAPQGDRGPYRLPIEAAASALAAAVAAYTRFGRGSHDRKVAIGIAFMIPHALAIALLNSWAEQPTTMRPLSAITMLILIFGMLTPARPRAILPAALVAASMDPLGVWVAHLRGLPVPSVIHTFAMFYPNYICALLAVAPSRVLYRLGRRLREARALGSYELVEPLGEGGMGQVWLARHRLLARQAAIKLIRPEMLGAGTRQQVEVTLGRFEHEARATAALTSPNTIRVFDFGVTGDGAFYYVMELLEGRDLESLVREFGPLPPARVLHLLRQMCRSLGEAHARGLVHRDVKPANIYLCRMGLEHDVVKVLDFGLVKQANPSHVTTVTALPVAVGTPAYMAPETIFGSAAVDARVDVYALGCVAYYLLTGERVFDGDSPMNLLMQHLQAPPEPPSRRAPHVVPRAIDDLVLACLEKDPSRRPRDAEAVFERARDCWTAGGWDDRAAKQWWDEHLPAFAGATAGKPIPVRAGASGCRADAGSARAPLQPLTC
jgi:serine/threonine-protein kinase